MVFSTLLKRTLTICVVHISFVSIAQQQSVAMQWNEVMLECIRKDAARPTVQARNLFHASVVMYDSWAIYDDDASTYFLGKTVGGFNCPFAGIPIPADIQAAQEQTISYAMYRFLFDRYNAAPSDNWNLFLIGYCNTLMAELGYDTSNTSTAYTDGDPAKLGNFIAQQMHIYAQGDGSNQQNNYANMYYEPVNGILHPQLSGNPNCSDPNRWQSISLTLQLDQNGFPVPNGLPALSHEWGNLNPFALTADQLTVYQRDGHDWKVYLDQGTPPLIDESVQTGFDDSFFKWGFCINSIWHSFHDTADGVMMDISPNSIGNVDVQNLPTTFEDYKAFYDEFNGGDPSTGYSMNPTTGLPYEEQLVPRGDYTRVLSEYWADGPSSETPPGHWYKILNEVAQHPLLEKQWGGQGPILDNLEWDVRAYLALGGGIHDAAIACWGTKGYYDYTRPIFAIRHMCVIGQSTDTEAPNYHPGGMPLIPGFIEQVEIGDPLAGTANEHVGKVKLYTWRGPVASTGLDGVGWILGENWWTFQRHTFVTPPFAGYYSGHSTYSRTGAEILTRITGDEYFPGGMGEFIAPQNAYLGATTGPSMDIHLQWAKYSDASDQCSLSRIYGGLHPPQDDIPGRKVGLIVGPQAFEKAEEYMDAGIPSVTQITSSHTAVGAVNVGQQFFYQFTFNEPMNTAIEPVISFVGTNPVGPILVALDMFWINSTTYRVTYIITDQNSQALNTRVKVAEARDLAGYKITPALGNSITFDLMRPSVLSVTVDESIVTDETVANGTFYIYVNYTEAMGAQNPTITFTGNNPAGTLALSSGASLWTTSTQFRAAYTVADANVQVNTFNLTVTGARDASGNTQIAAPSSNLFAIDTSNPMVIASNVGESSLDESNFGTEAFTIVLEFSEAMDTEVPAQIAFSEDVAAAGLVLNESLSEWVSNGEYHAVYDLTDANTTISGVTFESISARDVVGNLQVAETLEGILNIDTQNPSVLLLETATLINDEVAVDGQISLTFQFDDAMDQLIAPAINFPEGDPTVNTLTLDTDNSDWIDANTYEVLYTVTDANEELGNITVTATGASDATGNPQTTIFSATNVFIVDTRNPLITLASANTYNITSSFNGSNGFTILVLFDEAMDESTAPVLTFSSEDPSPVITANSDGSEWINSTTYLFSFDVLDVFQTIPNVDVLIEGALDAQGNEVVSMLEEDFFDIHTIVGVNEVNGPFEGLEIYPNPVRAGDDLIIGMNQIPADIVIRILDAAGRTIQIDAPRRSGNKLTVNTASFAAGIYMLDLSSENGHSSYRIILTN